VDGGDHDPHILLLKIKSLAVKNGPSKHIKLDPNLYRNK
jgi:hypothetical protein